VLGRGSELRGCGSGGRSVFGGGVGVDFLNEAHFMERTGFGRS